MRPSPAQVAAAPIDGAQQVVVGQRSRCGDRRRRRRRPPGRRRATATATAPVLEVETVHRAGGGADDELIVERAQAGGRALELTRPVGAAGGQRPARPPGRRRGRGTARRAPAPARSGPRRRATPATAAHRQRRGTRPDRRPRARPRASRCPSRAARPPAPGNVRCQTTRPVAASSARTPPVIATNTQAAAGRRRPRRLGVGHPTRPARVDVEGDEAPARDRDVGRRDVESRRRRDGQAFGADPADVERAAGQQLESGGHRWRRLRRRRRPEHETRGERDTTISSGQRTTPPRYNTHVLRSGGCPHVRHRHPQWPTTPSSFSISDPRSPSSSPAACARRTSTAKSIPATSATPGSATTPASTPIKGVILSGSHASTYEAHDLRAPEAVWELGVPVLGICYGMFTMAVQQGGEVEASTHREFGYAEVRAHGHTRLLEGIEDFRTDGRPRHAERVDEPWRQGDGAAARLRADGLDAELSDRRHGRRERAASTACSSTPR